MPSPLKRREWLEQKAAEESLRLPPLQPAAFCDRCWIAIGPYCAEEEAWLYPEASRLGLKFQVICGDCADRLALDFRYRIIDQEKMRTLRRFQVAPLLQAAKKELESDYRSRARK